MLINALCDYYDILKKNGNVLPSGYSSVPVSYLISLTADGLIDDIIYCEHKTSIIDKKGRTKDIFAPKHIYLPKRTEKSTIDSNIVEHRPMYIFGLGVEKKDGIESFVVDDKTHKAKKSHKAFVDANLEFTEGIESEIVKAYRNFIINWNSANETDNVLLNNIIKPYSKVGFAFCLSGRPDVLLHEDKLLLEKWDKYYTAISNDDSSAIRAQCGITGEIQPIARIHNKIKGVINGQPSGTTLVCFKNASESSYVHNQSYNSNISEIAMKKYTEALNFLLSSKRHRTFFDDVTVVFWAASGDDKCCDLLSMLVFDEKMDRENTDEFLLSVVEDCRNGIMTAEKLKNIDLIDLETDFYFVGIKPNTSRLSIKFIYKNRFCDIVMNVLQHQEDMKLKENSRSIPLWRIKKELVSPKSSNDNVNPALLSKLFESVMLGKNYPDSLFYTIIQRVKTDSDTDKDRYIKINDVRIGIIKAFINRKLRLSGHEEVIKLALDKENKDPAYLCGRLFAILEAIQMKASNYSLNRTIKDSYFSSAASRPAAVFPKIMKLSQYHLSKLSNPKYFTDDIKEVVDLIDGAFPVTLTLQQQGNFIISYYQQKNYMDNRIKEKMEDKKNDN